MSALVEHYHGKNRVRLLKTRRGVDGVHNVLELTIQITLWGDYERACRGDLVKCLSFVRRASRTHTTARYTLRATTRGWWRRTR